MIAPTACVLNSAGINCNLETGYAFEQYGARAEQVHISQLHTKERDLQDYQILVLPGGFSDGDAIQAGRTLGLELQTRLSDELNHFVAAGGLIIGICNGFQTLTETGLLPNGVIEPGRPKKLSLVHNSLGKFVDNWQYLLTERSRCLFAQPENIGEIIELPVANGEGRLVSKDTHAMAAWLALSGQVVFRYATAEGDITEDFPENPSGSLYGIAGICDLTGQILGLMPHPERFVDKTQHPNWRRSQGKVPFGGLIIKQMVKVARTS